MDKWLEQARPEGATGRKSLNSPGGRMKHLLGIQEVAALMGVSRQRIWKRKEDGTMPEPYALVGGKRPVWTREQIEGWKAGD